MVDILAAENEALRLENDELRTENRALGGRLQAAARARMRRTHWYERSSVVRALRRPPPPPSVRAQLQPSADGRVTVQLRVVPSVAAMVPVPEPAGDAENATAAKGKARPKAAVDFEVPPAVLVSISIVVGVLAVLMTRNPRAASKVAAAAAATVRALFVQGIPSPF